MPVLKPAQYDFLTHEAEVQQATILELQQRAVDLTEENRDLFAEVLKLRGELVDKKGNNLEDPSEQD